MTQRLRHTLSTRPQVRSLRRILSHNTIRDNLFLHDMRQKPFQLLLVMLCITPTSLNQAIKRMVPLKR